ncbi:outer membrane protein [Desulfosediminicola sp.]|uniref:outer membrane protein n=1 Tax=Desulfosediminicola sp. TaxID=2886825 RepID=UPI003AF24ECA
MLINFAVSDAEAAKLYVSGHLGAAFADDSDWGIPSELDKGMSIAFEYDAGWSGLAAVGYEFEKFRFEAEFGYQGNGLDAISLTHNGESRSQSMSGDLNLLTLMVNGYYSFINSSKFTPYVTMGLGAAYVEMKDLVPSSSEDKMNFYDTVFAYQFGAGVEYGVSEQLFLDLRYRYLATSDVALGDIEEEIDMEFASHNIYAGLRYQF